MDSGIKVSSYALWEASDMEGTQLYSDWFTCNFLHTIPIHTVVYNIISKMLATSLQHGRLGTFFYIFSRISLAQALSYGSIVFNWIKLRERACLGLHLFYEK